MPQRSKMTFRLGSNGDSISKMQKRIPINFNKTFSDYRKWADEIITFIGIKIKEKKDAPAGESK